MGKRNRRHKKELRQNKREKKVWHRKHYYVEQPVDLGPQLKKLKEELDLVILEVPHYDDPVADRWSLGVLRFHSGNFVDPDRLVPLKFPFHGPADIYMANWEAFLEKFWEECVEIQKEQARLAYLISYVNKKSTEAWQLANDTDIGLPNEYEVFEATADILYDQFLGTKRCTHIWRDQLRWACEFLKIEIP